MLNHKIDIKALLYAMRRITQKQSVIKGVLISLECFIKKTLSYILWSAWQFRINPFMFIRGIEYTTGRYYIRKFLKNYTDQCAGYFLEFGDPYFRDCFTSEKITGYDIMDIVSRPDITILADIQNCPEIANNTYDVIVCTQVLEHIANPFKAVIELHRILKPGGKLLLSVPAAFPYHAVPNDYWRYTRDSVHLLLDPLFSKVILHNYGNQLIVTAAYWYWMVDHLPHQSLDIVNPDCPTIICAYAVK